MSDGDAGAGRAHRGGVAAGVDIWKVENGQIVEHWDVLDINGLLKQLAGR